MYLSRLRLLNFRPYREGSLDLVPGVNLVVGENGQGKTSLLEAIATLALTRSPRSGSAAECVTWGEDLMGVWAQLRAAERSAELELRVQRSSGSERWTRIQRRDGESVPARLLVGTLRVVLFWPEDLLLVKGGPEPRRRLLDVVLSQLSRGYADAAVRCRRVVEHRAALLRRAREGQDVGRELAPWTEALVEYGSAVMEARADYLSRVAPAAATALLRLGEVGELGLSYRPGLGRAQQLEWSAGRGPELIRAALSLSAPEELARGLCLVGPHRDDFDIVLDGHAARQFASQGQQRSIVLALKVAEVRRHLDLTAEAPLLLLDDVLSELDRERRTRLVRLLGDELAVEQTLLTSTDDSELSGAVEVARTIDVGGGRVTPRGQHQE